VALGDRWAMQRWLAHHNKRSRHWLDGFNGFEYKAFLWKAQIGARQDAGRHDWNLVARVYKNAPADRFARGGNLEYNRDILTDGGS